MTKAYEDKLNKLIDTFPKKNLKTFNRFLAEYGQHVTIGTLANHGYVLKSLAENAGKPFEDIDKDDIIKWLQSLNGKSDNTIRREKATIKAFYKWLNGGDEYPDKVRWIKHRVKKTLPTNIPDEATIKKIIEHGKYQRDRAILFVLYDSGCRIGEILNMKIGDVTFDDYGAFFICDGKTGQRRIRLIDSVPDLQAWYNEHPRGNEKDAPLWVQVSDGSKQISYAGIKQMLTRTAAHAGFTGINPHKFRHAKLTQLAKDFSESELKVIAGWVGDSRMAGTYVHLSGADIERKMLEKRGMLKPEDKQEEHILQPRPCPRKCKGDDGKVIIYSGTAKFCTVCGSALSLDAAAHMDKVRSDMTLSMMGIATEQADDPEKILFEKLWREMRANKEK